MLILRVEGWAAVQKIIDVEQTTDILYVNSFLEINLKWKKF